MGAVAGTGKLPVKRESLLEAVRELVPAKHLDVNLRAFDLGWESVSEKKLGD